MGRILKMGCLGIVGLVGFMIVGFVAIAIFAPPPTDKEMRQLDKQLEDGGQHGGGGQPQEPQGPEDHLEVMGTSGIPFSCSVMDGNGQQRTVDGRTPMKIPLKDMGFGASSYNSCQKKGTEGTLEVAIYVGGEKKASNETSAQYGLADVQYPQ